MKIVVIGGTGLIGSKLVNILQERGHEALAASPKSGVNSVSGDGLADAVNGTIEIGGPEQFRLDELARRFLAVRQDTHQSPREVVSDPHGQYYGFEVSERALVPDGTARLGEIRFESWLTQSVPASESVQPAAAR